MQTQIQMQTLPQRQMRSQNGRGWKRKARGSRSRIADAPADPVADTGPNTEPEPVPEPAPEPEPEADPEAEAEGGEPGGEPEAGRQVRAGQKREERRR
jgi:hypothetical protein